MKRCASGHYYDENKYSSCPNCGVPGLNIDSVPTDDTVPIGGGGGATPADNISTDQTYAGPKPNVVTRHGGGGEPYSRDPEATVGLVRKKLGIDPVVGWLVCTKGPERGRDYRIRSERNFVGRDSKMDICIAGDAAISRENHVIISYNPKNKGFLLIPGSGKSIVYVNDNELTMAQELHAYDVIEMGESAFLFVPFCGSQFHWDSESHAS